MADSGTGSGWSRIQAGVKDTERLIGQKEYNAAMIKARQTLEFVANLLAERACILDSTDLKDKIDSLYQDRWISRETCEAFHKIRMLGNKAVHEGDDDAYNASQACQLLVRETRALTGESGKPRSASRQTRAGKSSSPSGSPGASRRTPAQQRRRKSGGRRYSSPRLYDILRLLAPILFIILLVLIIKLVKPAPATRETSTSAETPAASAETMTPLDAPETTAAPIPAEPAQTVYRTTANLNVRPQPSTEGTPVGQLGAGAVVAYLRAYNEEWAVIQYGDQEAYVASRYLTTE